MSGTLENGLLPRLRQQAYANLDASRHLVQFEQGLDPRFDTAFAPMVATSTRGGLRILNLNAGSGQAACHFGTLLRDRGDHSHVVCLANELAEPEGWGRFTLNVKSLGLHHVVVPLGVPVMEGLHALQSHCAVFDLIYVGGIAHSRALRRQFEQAWPLLSTGGLLSGDHFTPGNPLVVETVQAFIRDYGLQAGTDQSLWFTAKPAAACSAA